jgi:hypothetical protein
VKGQRPVPDIFYTLLSLAQNLGALAVEILQLALAWALLIAWLAWWLLAVDWKKTWPVLAGGAWAPVALLLFIAALVWSRLAPQCPWAGFEHLPTFWWQLGAVAIVAALTLFCGWLQGVFGWTPAEISLEPPPPPAGDGHGHH